MSAKRRYTPRRSEDKTTITFSCPKVMKQAVQEAADADKRSVSTWLEIRINEYLQRRQNDREPSSEGGGEAESCENQADLAARLLPDYRPNSN